MSSTYRPICLSHNPAIELDIAWHSGNNGLIVGEQLTREGFSSHPDCDIILGKYSYPLIEVGCIGHRNKTFSHEDTKWIDAEWIALLIKARKNNIQLPYPIMTGCWNPERVKGLTYLLPHYLEEDPKS